MLYEKMNSILEHSTLDEMDSLFESIIEDLDSINVEVPLRNGITESMLYRHNIMKGSIMYPLFEQEDFDTSNAQDVNYEEVDDGKDNSSKKDNKSGTEINTTKNSFFKNFINTLKMILDKFLQLIKKAVVFFSEKIFNNDKFLKEHQKELEETLRKTPTIEGKIPSISVNSIENGENTFFTNIATKNIQAFSEKLTEKLIKEGKTMSCSELTFKAYSQGKGTDLYSVIQVVREKFLEPNRGKKGTIKLAESKEIIDKYGREYLKFLKEQIGDLKKTRENAERDMEQLNQVLKQKLEGKSFQIAVDVAKCSCTTLINIHKEVINIMRQGIGEHERILKSAILKNTKSDK